MPPPDSPPDAIPPPYGSLTNLKILKFTGILILLLLLRSLFDSETDTEAETNPAEPDPVLQIEMVAPSPPGDLYGPPTPQRLWLEVDNPDVYMPTGSGRVESASYGSVRTQRSGRATFHEGVDIAPVNWRQGRAADSIYAVSDGEIVYINRIAGNSSYGIYVVIRHQDAIGEVYSLYAHMASVEASLSAGDPVQRGDTLGVMGHTSTLGIPRRRSHLHFELCLMLNPDFQSWYASQRLSPNHQRYHGYNLVGLNPHFLLATLHNREEIPFSFKNAIIETDTAWTILIKTKRIPAYFRVYPDLWEGGTPETGAIVLDVSESGVILKGRPATKAQAADLGSSQTRILEVNSEALGRNGLRHIRKQGTRWSLGRNGERWLDILLYHP